MDKSEQIMRRANDARALRSSAPFARFLEEVRDEATATFLTAESINEDVHQAHSMLKALAAIEARIAWAIAEAEKQQKGQHLARD